MYTFCHIESLDINNQQTVKVYRIRNNVPQKIGVKLVTDTPIKTALELIKNFYGFRYKNDNTFVRSDIRMVEFE